MSSIPARIVLLICLALVTVLGTAAGSGPDTRRYIVRFESPPLAEWRGGFAADGTRLKATSPEVTGASRLDTKTPESKAYLAHLDRERARVLDSAGKLLGRMLAPRFVYRNAFNGMALDLTAAEARRLRNVQGVVSVQPDFIRYLHTDAGPAWINADDVWNGSAPFSGTGNQGEGVIIGVVDSGISPAHPSFAAVGGDGYHHNNPLGHFVGLCADGAAQCNDKLIGIYDFTDEGSNGADTTGHGTHVASIAAGNHVDATIHGHTLDLTVPISGVAPHANLIAYKACNSGQGDQEEGCPGSAILDALDQALTDGVDVVNFSIGRFPANSGPWDAPDAIAMRNLRGAGTVVVVSAGNDGPDAGTISAPADAPWVIAAANSSHDRRFLNRLTDMSGGNRPAPGTLTGVGFTGGYGPAKIVHAREFGNALCGKGEPTFPPTGASNPFPPGTFHGEIVVCDRGKYARVEKGYNVLQSGAGGYVLANTREFGEDIVGDDHYLPAVHLGFEDGSRLRRWLLGGGDRSARITGAERVVDPSFGDLVASSSSRGPASKSPDVMKPDIAAPGTEILGAAPPEGGDNDRYQFLTGTSMASPHVAGAAALVRAAHPYWSVADIHSALVMTALPGNMTDAFSGGKAGATVRGGGRVNAAGAVAAGLVMEQGVDGFRDANPDQGGSPRELNLPALADDACFLHCQWTRTVKAVRGGISWRVEVDAPDGVEVHVTPQQFTMSQAGSSQELTVRADVSGATVGEWTSGRLRLVPVSGGGATPKEQVPLSVFVSGGELPELLTVNADTDGGFTDVTLDGLVPLADLSLETHGPSPALTIRRSLRQDPTRFDPYDNPNDGTSLFRLVQVNEGDRMLLARITQSTATDMDLYVGRDAGDGKPDLDEELCASTTPTTAERCVLSDPQPGNYWVLVQDWQARSEGATDTVSLDVASVPGEAGGLTASGPASTDVREAFPVRLAWDRGDLTAHRRWYGAVGLGTDPGHPRNLGLVPVLLKRSSQPDPEPLELLPSETRTFTVPAHGRRDGLYIDLPVNTRSLTVDAGGETGSLSLYARRGSPPEGTTTASLTASADVVGSSESLVLDGNSGVAGGRWFITPFNDSAADREVSLDVSLDAPGPSIQIQRGMWFNPARPGHGIDLNRSGDNLFVVWFTYLEDGSPAWYLASGPYQGDFWSAPLTRYVWNGASARPTEVGSVSLTFTAPDAAIFNWRLYGESGSEPFRPCEGAPTCIPGGLATPMNVSGHWYPPMEPGWGDTVVRAGDIELDTVYLYDAHGNPRWLQAVNDSRDQTAQGELLTFRGFCPVCEWVQPVTSHAGAITTSFSDLTHGHFSVDATFPEDWAGEWRRDVEVEQLSDPAR